MKKELCRRCHSDFARASWLSADDSDWENGVVLCPFVPDDRWRTIACGKGNEPPVGCPFALEQLVLEQEESL